MHKIYLIPNFLAPNSVDQTFPLYLIEIVKKLKIFFVEDEKTARSFLKKINPTINFSEIILYNIGKHADFSEVKKAFNVYHQEKKEIGILSEAGYPCIADPGEILVRWAHEKNWQIQPLIGPCSLTMALAASGLSGQKFSFHGYLPIQSQEKTVYLQKIQSRILQEYSTHLFIETPFRNVQLMETICKVLSKNLQLCLALEITSDTEKIKTQTISAWQKEDLTFLHKKNCVFILGY